MAGEEEKLRLGMARPGKARLGEARRGNLKAAELSQPPALVDEK
jgi:hypothetical protein